MINTAKKAGDVLCCKYMVSTAVSPEDAAYDFLSDQDYLVELSPLKNNSSIRSDELNYSQAWFAHHKRREQLFKPWMPVLSIGDWELHRLQAITNFWRAAKTHKISPVTIHLAVWLLNKLLYCTTQRGLVLTKDYFAGLVAVSFRIALKFEERPDALWGIRKIWDVLPMFDSWVGIDKRNAFLMKVESDALRMLDDLLDVPLAVQFFDKYIAIGGWPADLRTEYINLGHYLLALSSFARSDDHMLCDVAPSVLAAAAVVLSIKIVNGDSKRCYEFFPSRFAVFSSLSMKELQPTIKGLSKMLRKKPFGSDILARVYPDWGEHEWQ